MKVFAVLLSLLTSSMSFAGGIHCKQCPAESNICTPRPDCAEGTSNAYQCQFEGSNSQFQIVENSPVEGFATIYSPKPEKPLKFSQSTEKFSTRCGPASSTMKTYFHPAYLYQITIADGPYLCGIRKPQIKGRYQVGSNPTVYFTCVNEK